MKNTWRHSVNDKYYTFRSYKVYNAFYCLKHDDRAMLRINKERYAICLENPSLMKMFFGQFDTLNIVRDRITAKELELKDKYLYLY